jgi:hypothetical protein
MLARTPLIQPHGGTDPRIGEPRPVEPFVDYGDLSHDTIVSIRNAADRIRNRHRDVIDGILKNGADLNVVKASLGHGRFGAWLKAEFGWSERTAENYMAAAREFGDKPAVASALSPTILYKLASRGTPAHIRDGVVSEVSAGVALPARTITDRIKRGKASGGCAKGHVPSGRLHAADPVSTSHQELAKASDVRHLEEAAHKRHAAASRAVEILRRRLGQDFETFRKVVSAIDAATFLSALRLSASATAGRADTPDPAYEPTEGTL